MEQHFHLAVYVLIGLLGAWIGVRLRIPGGALIGAMVAVIVFKTILKQSWSVTNNYSLLVQALAGIMVGIRYDLNMAKVIDDVAGPVVVSTIVLVSVGFLLSLLITKIWPLMNIYTAYLGTSPGAMSALIPLADDSPANVAFVGAFHFFRLVFIILIAPLIYKFIQMWPIQQ